MIQPTMESKTARITSAKSEPNCPSEKPCAPTVHDDASLLSASHYYSIASRLLDAAPLAVAAIFSWSLSAHISAFGPQTHFRCAPRRYCCSCSRAPRLASYSHRPWSGPGCVELGCFESRAHRHTADAASQSRLATRPSDYWPARRVSDSVCYH